MKVRVFRPMQFLEFEACWRDLESAHEDIDKSLTHGSVEAAQFDHLKKKFVEARTFYEALLGAIPEADLK